MAVPRTLSFRHGVDQLYVKVCQLRDGRPLDPSSASGLLEPAQLVAGLGRSWSRAKLVRAAVVITAMPLLAFVASRLGVPLWASLCSLVVLGPLLWMMLSTALVFRTVRRQGERITAQLEQRRREAAVLREVTLEVGDDGLVFTTEGLRLTHPWRELASVRPCGDGLVLGLELALPDAGGRFEHEWTVPPSAFVDEGAMRELAAALEERRRGA